MPFTPSYLIGVDTGGTYTDCALIEARGHQVVASAKAITTKGDLSIGVTEAINPAVAQMAGRVAAQDIGLVSVSTTLATNAVVEGHGSPVAVVLVGFDVRMAERTGIAAAFPGGRALLRDSMNRRAATLSYAVSVHAGLRRVVEHVDHIEGLSYRAADRGRPDRIGLRQSLSRPIS